MTEKFTDSSASRIIAALDGRAERKLKNGAQTLTTWGSVGAVDAGNKTASAYIYGETDGAYMSEGFRIPETMYLSVGQKVKVAIDHATGERWVDEVLYPTSAYKKIAVDVSAGAIKFGLGTAEPTLSLYASTTGSVTLENGTVGVYLNSTGADPYSAIVFRHQGANRVLLDYGTGTTDDFRMGLYTGAAGAESFTEYLRLIATTAGRVSVSSLQINGGGDVELATESHGLTIGVTSGTNIAIDGNEIMARNNGAKSYLYLNNNGGQVIIGGAAAGTTSDDGLTFHSDVNLFRAEGGHLKLTYAGGSGYGKLTIGDTDNGADTASTKLTIGIERPWVFEQYSSGASTALALTPLTTGGKTFHITDSASNPVFTVAATDSGPYVAVSTHYRVGSNQVVGARKTGWGAPTGTATRTSFATDTVTLINLARAVKALVDDLTSHGLIGA